MRKACLGLAFLAVVAAFVLVLAAMPTLIQARGSQLYLNWGYAEGAVRQYFADLFSGKPFVIRFGRNEMPFFQAVWSYFFLSFGYLLAAGIVAITLGIGMGIRFTRLKRRWLKQLVEMVSVLPDFIIILLLQLLVVFVYKATGVRLARVGSFSINEPAVLLPLASMIIVPGLYMMRNVSVHTYHVLTEEYILHAKAKGLSNLYIFVFHVLRNVLPFVKADLHKFLGLMMGNLFIVEYLYNLRGMTKLIFTGQQRGAYSYDLTANSFLMVVLLYALVFLGYRAYIWFLERNFAHE